jgi:hypothetical protein
MATLHEKGSGSDERTIAGGHRDFAQASVGQGHGPRVVSESAGDAATPSHNTRASRAATISSPIEPPST